MTTMFSPLRYLENKIKNVFFFNNADFYDAIMQNFKVPIKIKLNSNWDEGWKHQKISVKIDKHIIYINENFLCCLWCMCYFSNIAFDKLNSFFNGKETCICFSEEDKIAIDYAKSIYYSYDNWPENLSKPCDEKPNNKVETANLVFLQALDYTICHEIAHIYLKHKPNEDKQQEIAADIQALKWTTHDNIPDVQPQQYGIMSAFATTILIDKDAKIDCKTHPSSFERCYNYLESLGIDDNDILWGFACLLYGIWENEYNTFNKVLLDNITDKTLKDRFKELINNK